jgi:tRNA(fMet)-specific endonuclease VapC
MSSHFLLDTNTVSYIVNGNSQAARVHLDRLRSDEVACISAITEAEMLYGLEKKPDARRLHLATKHLLSKLEVFPWRSQEARVFGTLRARLEASGKTLGPMDMLIAAHAISLNAILITNDKALLKTEGLREARSWATDI